MRWTLITCFLLASVQDIAQTARPKRDLRTIKNHITSKLFGTETLIVEIPEIPKNESYQLFKIKGYDNIYLKVTRKPEKPVRIQFNSIQFENPMVNPEIAIIGNYLGTTTQKDTLLALEITKNLMKSGILKSEQEKVEQDIVLPMLPQNPYKYIFQEPVKPVGVITEERRPIYADSPFLEAERVVLRKPSQNPYNGYVVREPVKPVEVITEGRRPIYVDSPFLEAERVVLPKPSQNLYNDYVVRKPVKPVEVITGERRPIYVDSPFLEAERVVWPKLSQNPYNGYVVREPVKPVEVITEEKPPIYVNSPVFGAASNVVNRHPAVVYPAKHPPMVVATEVKYNPIQTKYSYKQETEDADMTYDSYNNRGVVVTRTNKVPAKPRYIALRLADVISIADNPHMIQAQPSHTNAVMYDEYQPFNVVPILPYVTKKTPQAIDISEVVEESGYVTSNYLNNHPFPIPINSPKVSESFVPNFITESKLPFDIRDHLTNPEIDKLNRFINEKLEQSKNNDHLFTSKPYDDKYSSEEDKNNNEKGTDDSQLSTGQILSRYSYKQLGDEDYGNYTVVRIEDPKLNQSDLNLMNAEYKPQNFIYVPPDFDVPPPVSNTNNVNAKIPRLKPNANNIKEQTKYNRQEENDSFNNAENRPKISVPISLRGDLGQPELYDKPGPPKINDVNSLTKNPIIVPEFGKENSNRPFIGGQASKNKSAST